MPSLRAILTRCLTAASKRVLSAPVTFKLWNGAGAKASRGLWDAQGRGAAVAVPLPCCLGPALLVGVSPGCASPIHALRAYDGLRAGRVAGSSSARSVPGLRGLPGRGDPLRKPQRFVGSPPVMYPDGDMGEASDERLDDG